MLQRIEEILSAGGAAGVIEMYLDRDSADRDWPPIDHFAGLEPFTDLHTLSVTGQELQSFGGLPAFVRLENLYLQGNQINSLADMPLLPALRRLDLSLNALCSLEGLPALPELTTLDLSHNPLQSLEGMPALPALRNLALSGNRKLHSLEGLAGLPGLEALHLRGTYLGDYSDLAGAVSLVELSLSPMSLDSIMRWPPQLQRLKLFAGRMEGALSLPPLPHLQQLELRNGAMVREVQGWQGLPQLQKAALSGLGLKACPAFPAGMPLRELDLSRNQIQDLDGLAGIQVLEVLHIGGNPLGADVIRTFRESRPDVRLEG